MADGRGGVADGDVVDGGGRLSGPLQTTSTLSAKRLLLISAPSMRMDLSDSIVSAPLSLPCSGSVCVQCKDLNKLPTETYKEKIEIEKVNKKRKVLENKKLEKMKQEK